MCGVHWYTMVVVDTYVCCIRIDFLGQWHHFLFAGHQCSYLAIRIEFQCVYLQHTNSKLWFLEMYAHCTSTQHKT